MFGFVGEFFRQLRKIMAVDTAVHLRVEFGQCGEDGLDGGVFFIRLSAQPPEVVFFSARFSKESRNDRHFGGAISRGKFAQSLDVTIHVSSFGREFKVQSDAPLARGSKFNV